MFMAYSLEDLLAKKIVALYNRMEGKDIYDVFHALNMAFERDKFLKALELTIKFYHIEGNFWNELINRLNQAKKNARHIGNSTNHFIPKTLRPNWEELINSLRFRIEELSTSDHGVFNLALTVLSIALVVATLGFPNSLPREVVTLKNLEEHRSVMDP